MGDLERVVCGLSYFIMNKNRPPNLDSTAICSLLEGLYPFKDVDRCSVTELPGYEDRNFYFKGRITSEDNGDVSSTS